jgi:hypothetical protein
VAVKPLIEKYWLEAELDPSGLLGPPEAVAPSRAGLRRSINLFAGTPFAMEPVLTAHASSSDAIVKSSGSCA